MLRETKAQGTWWRQCTQEISIIRKILTQFPSSRLNVSCVERKTTPSALRCSWAFLSSPPIWIINLHIIILFIFPWAMMKNLRRFSLSRFIFFIAIPAFESSCFPKQKWKYGKCLEWGRQSCSALVSRRLSCVCSPIGIANNCHSSRFKSGADF